MLSIAAPRLDENYVAAGQSMPRNGFVATVSLNGGACAAFWSVIIGQLAPENDELDRN